MIKINKIKHIIKTIRTSLQTSITQYFYNKKSPINKYCNDNILEINKIDLITIAFNNVFVVHSQIKLLQKHMLDQYTLCIADNSTDTSISKEIQQICVSNNTNYIRLPINPSSHIKSSTSHAYAINYILENYLKSRTSRYYGFLDHDIFPTNQLSITTKLQTQPYYGGYQYRNEKVFNGICWYLWAGFCFFDRNYIKPTKLNFHCCPSLDTGGSNYRILKNLFKKEFRFPNYNQKKVLDGISKQNAYIEYYDDWVHLFNVSGWMKISQNKNEFNYNFIKRLLDE